MSIIFKNFDDYKDESLLVVPYRTIDFEYYGGEFVNYSSGDYRGKIA